MPQAPFASLETTPSVVLAFKFQQQTGASKNVRVLVFAMCRSGSFSEQSLHAQKDVSTSVWFSFCVCACQIKSFKFLSEVLLEFLPDSGEDLQLNVLEPSVVSHGSS